MNKLKLLLNKKELLVAGLISGTSTDGIDACLVKIKGLKNDLGVKFLGFRTYKYPPPLRSKIFEFYKNKSQNLDDLVRLNMLLGKRFARAVVDLYRELRVDKSRIDLIGSHGQTIRHLPRMRDFCGEKIKGTLQVGDPSVIAAETGITTVGDFRIADMAVGGEGAPLCPLIHFYLFKDRYSSRAVLNIGGIANITILPRRCKIEDVFAFDSGPGNVLIDSLTNKLYNKKYDKDGNIALSGKINRALLEKLCRNNYFKKRPPKSTGREDFEKDLKYILSLRRIPKEDIIATVSELVCWSIFHSYKKWIKPKGKIDELIVCGGGAYNRYIIKRLSLLFHPVKVVSSEKVGFHPDQIEAIFFAILAYLTIKGEPGNLKKVTGAKRELKLGKICLP